MESGLDFMICTPSFTGNGSATPDVSGSYNSVYSRLIVLYYLCTEQMVKIMFSFNVCLPVCCGSVRMAEHRYK